MSALYLISFGPSLTSQYFEVILVEILWDVRFKCCLTFFVAQALLAQSCMARPAHTNQSTQWVLGDLTEVLLLR